MVSIFHLLNTTNTNKQMNTRHFSIAYLDFFTYTYVKSAAEGIESIAIRLRAQRLAAELSVSVMIAAFISP